MQTLKTFKQHNENIHYDIEPFNEEDWNDKNLCSSDEFISSILNELGIKYRIGKDSVGNDNVFITVITNINPVKFEIYSTTSNVRNSGYHVRYYKMGVMGDVESFMTTDLKRSILDILYLD